MNAAPLALSPEEKLDLLRYLDRFRFWYGLDDDRICGQCHRIITGRQIIVAEAEGDVTLQCPTVGCLSTAGDWYYADPVEAATRQNPPPAIGQIFSDNESGGSNKSARWVLA
ncbi:MAG TPA: hypothetical protein VK581_03375 [Chthoniobacterales bacterium]|nr:hypothetical protein [Chthoniobacterales bacterium]